MSWYLTDLRNLKQLVADWLFPQSDLATEITRLTPEKFGQLAEPAAGRPHPLIRPLFDYRDPYVRKAVHLLKYPGQRQTIQLLGSVMASELPSTIEGFQLSRPLITPVPLSQNRLSERGFNQAELLTKMIEAGQPTPKMGDFHYQLLVKVQDTVPQTGLQRSQRLQNLKHCFSVNRPTLIAGRDILVIDDVSTTGSTLLEIMKTLKRAGANKAAGLVIAH